MTSIIVHDAALLEQLRQAPEGTLLCDPNGLPIGILAKDTTTPISLSQFWTPKEELDRRANEPGGKTLDEIWKKLGAK